MASDGTSQEHRNRVMLERADIEVTFVECIDCGVKDELRNPRRDRATYSDEQATVIFQARGWTVKPTRCPSCAAKAAAPEPRGGEAAPGSLRGLDRAIAERLGWTDLTPHPDWDLVGTQPSGGLFGRMTVPFWSLHLSQAEDLIVELRHQWQGQVRVYVEWMAGSIGGVECLIVARTGHGVIGRGLSPTSAAEAICKAFLETYSEPVTKAPERA